MKTETYDTYAEVARRATYLARTCKTAVQVLPDGLRWKVVVPETYLPRSYPASRSGYEIESGYEDEPYYEDEQKRADRVEELLDAQDNWARSDEDGWFYPDDSQ